MKPTHRHSELAPRSPGSLPKTLPANKRQLGRGARFTRTGARQQRGTLSYSVGQTFLSAYSFMKRLAHSRWIAAAASTGLLLTLAACGGSGGGNTFNPPPPALTITTTSLPDGNLNQSYNSALLLASGGTGARTWSLASGSGPLPDGLTLSSSGVISGIPSVEGTFNFTVQVTDSSSPQQVATRALSILVSGLRITTTALPNGQVGVAYSHFVSATNGQQPFSWSISAPALPTGLSIDTNTGEIGGLPMTAGTFPFTVRVTDDLGDTATADLTIVVDPPPPLMLTTTALPDGAVNVAYNVTLQATGGQPPLTWSIPTGVLPSGLSLDASSGVISGTPAVAVTESFTVQATDSASPTMQTASQPLTLTIVSVLSGRNDTTTTATPLFNGTFRASISPYIDPLGGAAADANPDVDVYEITANAGNMVTIRICARSTNCNPSNPLPAPSVLDSVLEIVNIGNVPFTTCRNEGSDDGVTGAVDTTPTAFDDACLNDDIQLGIVQDSKLEFQVPGSGAVTFFVRVLGFRGDARPDMLYDIIISGAN